jgi:hypothetical protein
MPMATTSTTSRLGGGNGNGNGGSSSSPLPNSSQHFHPKSSSSSPPLTTHYFITRPPSRRTSSTISTYDLPMEKNAIGLLSPTGIFFSSVKLTVPLAYIYIALILWRELCFSFPQSMLESEFMTMYFSVGVWTARTMTSSSWLVEAWAVIEGIFYVILFWHRKYLNSLDTLELSLRSAPMLETRERSELWELMMDCEEGMCSKFISGWFFGEKIENLTRLDVMDFLTWSLFEGRSIEHLTLEETHQLRGFLADLENNISIEQFGIEESERIDEDGHEGEVIQEGYSKDDERKADCTDDTHPMGFLDGSITPMRKKKKGREPKRRFRFQETRNESHPSYFSDLYESYKVWCDHQYRGIMENRSFNSLQDLRNFVAEKTQQLHHAEQSAVATASESLQHAYFSLIEKDGMIDKQLTALSHATQLQISEAWNSIWKMKERLRTASDISLRRKALLQQLKSYRKTLAQMRSMATAVPSKQMADLMKKITQCYEALESVEASAKDAFVQVTGFVGKNLLSSKDPPRYLK